MSSLISTALTGKPTSSDRPSLLEGVCDKIRVHHFFLGHPYDHPVAKFKDTSYHYVIGHLEHLTSNQVLDGFFLTSWQTEIVITVVEEAHYVVQWALIFVELFWK